MVRYTPGFVVVKENRYWNWGEQWFQDELTNACTTDNERKARDEAAYRYAEVKQITLSLEVIE